MTAFPKSRSVYPALLAPAAAVLLAACGGGGGGGGPSLATPTPPPPPPPPGPSASSPEYQRSWGLAGIHADAVYAQGASGRGITVAVIDTGVDGAQPDLLGAVSPASTDVVGTRHTPVGSDLHGTRVAGIIASRFNGMGTVGVAYASTILSVRADSPPAGSCSDCMFTASDLARGLDYAVATGARVVNLSVGDAAPLGSTFEAALARATAAGVVVAASAGNEGEADPDWPGRYAVDPRFQGSVIAVGALAQDGTLASYSDRAGVAAAGYIAAPGDKVITNCSTSSCWEVSGTSFSAPHVSGALALLLQTFPNLSGRDAVDILLRTAADSGAAGTDAIYGRGSLDLARAFSPIGASSLPLPGGGATVVAATAPGTSMASAFGVAAGRNAALKTVIHDDYRRLFQVDLAEGLPTARRAGLVQIVPAQASSEIVLGGPQLGGLTLAFAAQAPLFETREQELSPFAAQEPMRSVRMQAAVGRLTLTTWQGEGGAAAPEGPAGRDAFQRIAQPDRATQASARLGRFALVVEQASSHPRPPLQNTEIDGTRLASATGLMRFGEATLSLTGGTMDEPLGPLGSYLAPGSATALPASTRFASTAVTLAPRPGLVLRAEAALGRTAADGKLLSLERAVSSAWRFGADADCRLLGWACSRISIEVSQPLRIESGSFQATLADVPLNYGDPLTFSTRRFSGAPDGREIDLILGVERAFGSLGALGVRTSLAVEPGHRQDADPELGVLASWRSRF